MLFGLAFPDRSDYLGHFLAGAGGTLALLALLLARAGPQRRAVVLVTVVAISIGVVTEATLFRLAIFDPVDLANQSLGAVVVGAGLVEAEGSLRLGIMLLPAAGALLMLGFFYAFR